MLIFVDTEFTNLTEPTLISIGVVAENGKELYLESTEFRPEDCSQFVHEVVLPQLGKARGASVNKSELKRRLLSWLDQFNDSREAVVVYDFDGDWTLLCDAINGEIPPWIGHRNVRSHINALLLEQFFAETGLDDHHALNDARANRYAYRPR